MRRLSEYQYQIPVYQTDPRDPAAAEENKKTQKKEAAKASGCEVGNFRHILHTKSIGLNFILKAMVTALTFAQRRLFLIFSLLSYHTIYYPSILFCTVIWISGDSA
jgi:hypothetical protein